jgi:hypothetical protein
MHVDAAALSLSHVVSLVRSSIVDARCAFFPPLPMSAGAF